MKTAKIVTMALLLVGLSSPRASAFRQPNATAEQFVGALQQDPAGNFSGRLYDLGHCWHAVTLDTSSSPWQLNFPAGDTCGDPKWPPALIIDLTPFVSSVSGSQGFYQSEPNCWLKWGNGRYSLTQQTDGSWLLVIDGLRGMIDYHACAASNP